MALEALAGVERLVATGFAEGNRAHSEALLQQLWSGLFPGQVFERTSPKWRVVSTGTLKPGEEGTSLLFSVC